jgi:DhnA family fructose-bisphosphate aldolase class Ia
MHPERVVIARVSAVIVTIIVVAAAVVVATAVGAFGVFSSGTSSQMYKSLSSLSAAAHELGL